MSMVSPRIRLTHWNDSALPGVFPARSFKTTRFSSGGNEPAVGGLQRHAALAQINDLELRVLGTAPAASAATFTSALFCVSAARKLPSAPLVSVMVLPMGISRSMPRARGSTHGVVVEVGIAAGLAGGVVVEQGGTNALEGRQLEGHGEGLAQRRELLAVGAPTEDGLVGVEVAVNAQPQMRRAERSG